MNADPYDLLVIGGGINGAGIARDAAGRGLSVLLVERDDLAAHTSSASTKLIHGGLRYLEYYEFRLVREALQERERLLRIAPHLIAPLEFVLPLPEGGRPGWMIRIGLWLYDHIGGHISLPGSRGVRLDQGGLAGVLKPSLTRGFVYSDCRVDDVRLVVANAMDAAARGATILTGVTVIGARPQDGLWQVELAQNPERPASAQAPPRQIMARAMVNAAGPWVGSMLGDVAGIEHRSAIQLVKGSHIVVPRCHDGAQAYIFQNPDGRIMFAIPYQQDFTLIGTTDIVVGEAERAAPQISEAEIDYLVASANEYFANPVSRAEIVWTYAGVRPLFDDGRADAKQITRDYVLQLGRDAAPQLLSVFGGKLTTYRRLADHALDKLKPWLAPMGAAWTDQQALPGGDLTDGDMAACVRDVQARWPFLSPADAGRLAHCYGGRVDHVLGAAQSRAELGEDFGGGLSASEVDYLCDHEWARTAQDILWRRTKLGLVCPPGTDEVLEAHLKSRSESAGGRG